MKKGFGLGWILLGAALLTPYATEKNEETGECEARSLLLKVKTKNTVEEDGSKHFDYKLNFAGIPTAEDLEIIRNNVSRGIAKASVGICKRAKKVSDAIKNATSGKCDDCEDFDGSEEDFENIFDDEPEKETEAPEEGSEAL